MVGDQYLFQVNTISYTVVLQSVKFAKPFDFALIPILFIAIVVNDTHQVCAVGSCPCVGAGVI